MSLRWLCEYCQIKFFSKNELVKHIQNIHECLICGFTASGETTHNVLRRHLNEEHNFGIDILCDICFAKRVFFYDDLDKHLEKKHGIKNNEKRSKSISHDKNGKIFNLEDNEPDTNNTSCHYCKTKFSSKLILRKHIELQHEYIIELRKPFHFKCLLCHIKCASANNLSDHYKTNHPDHDKENRVVVYPILESLEDYEEEEMSHCEKCNFQTSSKKGMTIHIQQMHPFKHQCIICLQNFISESDLRLHMSKNNHNKAPPLDTRKALCEKCDFQTSSRKGMQIHIQQMHPREYQCITCLQSFMNKRLRSIHIQQKHSFKKHKCFKCLQNFVSDSDLRLHMAKGHNKVPILKMRK